MKSPRSRAIAYGLMTVVVLLCALPNLLPSGAAKWLPVAYVNHTVTLGLDLQGGSHLLLAADFQQLVEAEHQQIAQALAGKLRDARIGHQLISANDDAIVFRFNNAQGLAAAKDFTKAMQSAQGIARVTTSTQGTELTVTLTDEAREYLQKDAIERSLEVLRRRLDETGLVEPSITRQGSDYILVQMPGVEDPSEIRALLGTTAKMTFHWAAKTQHSPANMTLADAIGDNHYVLESRVALEGRHISDAQLAFNQETQEPVVSFKLDREGARTFGDMTRDNVGRALAIVLDDAVLTAPVIRGVIAGGSGEISGDFSAYEASKLALLLRAGALPVPLDVVEERTVGPDLGSDAITMGLATGFAGAAVVLLFMLAIYGRWGAIACVSLAVNFGLLIGILSLLGATLTLPGIAGIILTIGMAVDANILINERIREETRRGAPARQALQVGFNRAYGTIVDSSVTTLIAVSLLFLVGSGPVRGFAVTIGIGLLTSLFTAMGVTRLLMTRSIKGREHDVLLLSGIKGLDALGQMPFNFLKGRIVGLTLSAILSLTAIGLYIKPGLQYGVDFTGGTVVEVVAEGVSATRLREQLVSHSLAGAAVQEFEQSGRYLVRLPAEAGNAVSAAEQISTIKSAVTMVQADASFPRVDKVGPKVSEGFADATVLAILLAGGGMLLYLWFRFESHFALAATLTIALDLTKTIGFFALTGVEFNLTAVAALLALIGYSVNDKVVVFDRIRETLRAAPDRPIMQVLNESISSTLTRTVYTSVTTFIALLPMGLFGGAAVASFAWPMLFGIVIGTSSSIFIASPLLFYLSRRRHNNGQRQLRQTREEMQAQLDLIP
ncbi:MAG TPA: protein translocase subunit SecD [Marinagarivorans sp.]